MCGFILGEQDASATLLIKKIAVTLKKNNKKIKTHTTHLMTDILRVHANFRFFCSPQGCMWME